MDKEKAIPVTSELKPYIKEFTFKGLSLSVLFHLALIALFLIGSHIHSSINTNKIPYNSKEKPVIAGKCLRTLTLQNS
ncbi:MAG: hypothetical protein N2510_03595 [Ignavibacteria bacterium]|nr:hypothetical protein [Ignavibacteria bacterium]